MREKRIIRSTTAFTYCEFGLDKAFFQVAMAVSSRKKLKKKHL